MLPLAGSGFPADHEALKTALEAGLKKHGIAHKSLRVEGDTYPQIEKLELDLSGAEVTRETRLPVAKSEVRHALTVANLKLTAKTLRLEKTPARLEIQATGAHFDFGYDSKKHSALILAGADKGDLLVQVQRADLEELLRTIATEAAAGHGVEVKSTRLELTTATPRTLTFRAEVKAKMFVMSATVTVSGEAEVDDQLNARLSKLTCSGDGMVGSVASGFIKPYFAKVENRPISLMALPLGTLKLRDISIAGGEALTLKASFQSEPLVA